MLERNIRFVSEQVSHLSADHARHARTLSEHAQAVLTLSEQVVTLRAQVNDLRRLWQVAQANPELVRELAAQALQGRPIA